MKKPSIPEKLLTAFCFVVVPLFFLAPSSSAAEECGSLIKSKCIRCHFETRICDKVEKRKGAWTWKRTIKSMMRYGTVLTKDEQKQLVNCLSQPAQAVLDICN